MYGRLAGKPNLAVLSSRGFGYDPRQIKILVHALRQGDRACHRPASGFLAGAHRRRRMGGHRSALHLRDTWQLVINTGTTIVTFLMVFLIQSTQNRDSEAMQLKLDELLRAARAHDVLMDIEELTVAGSSAFAWCT